MLWVTTWASLQCPLLSVPHEVYSHPWFIATMGDAYWGFITFFVWVCFKQKSVIARTAWFIAIILLGNIAMSAYCLSELSLVSHRDQLAGALTTRRPGPGWLGLVLAATGLVVVALA